MKDETFYDLYFRESEEEKRINAELEAERKRHEETEEYKRHQEKLGELLDRLKVEGQKRREEAKKHKPKRRAKAKHISEEEMAKFREQNRLEKEARIDALPEPLRSTIRNYEALPDEAKKVFRKETWVYEPDYDDYKEPVTTKNDMKELLEILVQTTIDFINERGLTDIYSVGFGADDLQGSAKFGEWEPCTDASIHVCGMGKEKGRDGHEYTVIQKIGEYM